MLFIRGKTEPTVCWKLKNKSNIEVCMRRDIPAAFLVKQTAMLRMFFK